MYNVLQETKYVKLEKLRISLVETIDPYLMDTIVETRLDEWLHRIEVRLQGYLMSESIGEKIIRYPADWWQAFKERWFPASLKRRFPVKYTQYDISLKAVEFLMIETGHLNP